MSQMKIGRNYIACGVSIFAMILLSTVAILILPVFIQNEYFSMEYTAGIIIILMGIAAFIGTMIIRMAVRERGVLLSALSIGVYYVLVMFLGVFLFDGLTLRMFYGLCSCAVGYFAAWMILSKRKKPHNKRGKWR